MSLYVTDQLSESDAEAFEKHYFGCDPCWTEVQRATEIQAALKGSPAAAPHKPSSNSGEVVRGPWTNWKWLALAAAVGVAAIAGTLLFLRGSLAGSPTSALVAAARERGFSPLEARLTDFPYLPPPPTTRASAQSTGNDSKYRRLRYAAVDAEKRADEHPTAANLHAAGIAHLLLWEWDEAIETLQRASKQAPSDSSVLSDLAAAYLEAGRHTQEQKYFRSAYEAAVRASEQKRHPVEALFNKALALEAIHQPSASAWEEYLARDPSSPWAAFARERLRAAQEQKQSRSWDHERVQLARACSSEDPEQVAGIVSNFRQEARLYTEDELLPRWGSDSASRKTASAVDDLRSAQCVAQSLLQVTGDSLLQDVVQQITRSSRAVSGSPTTQLLRKGYAKYGLARRLYKERQIEPALTAFRDAQTILTLAQSPFSIRASIEMSGCLFNQNAFPAALAEIESIRIGTDAVRYPLLSARLYWLRGMLELLLGHPHEALADYRTSLAIFQRADEKENTGALHSLVAGCLSYLGENEKAWVHREEALRLLVGDKAFAWRPLALGDAARAALSEGAPRLALAYLDEQVELARASSNPPLESEAFRLRSLARGEIRDRDGALTDLKQALTAARKIDDSSIRARSEADAREVDGRLCLEQPLDRCIDSLTASIEFFGRTGNHLRLAQSYLERGDLFRASESGDRARADFERGISEIEAQRERLPTEDLRISYFETAEALFDREIEILAVNRQVLGSLAMAERARSRALLDLVSGDLGRRFAAAIPAYEFPAQLPQGLTVVEYRVLPRFLCTWVITSDSTTLTLTRIDADELAERASQFLKALREQPAKPLQESRAFSELLLRPAANRLASKSSFVFVPHRFLSTIPFAALVDPRAEHFLIERHAVSVAPSIEVFLKQQVADRALYPISVLAVGNPRFDRKLFPALPDLPSAEREARAAATFHKGSDLLIGASATKAAFFRLAAQHSVLHYAGHAMVDPERPSLSALLLAPDPAVNDSGVLYAHEIASGRYPRLRVVVLDACQTATGRILGSEGSMSLARAFLAAGVPQVIATLWDVSDSSGPSLADIYASSPITIAGGLRRVQLQMLRRPGALADRADWAAFSILGALPPEQASGATHTVAEIAGHTTNRRFRRGERSHYGQTLTASNHI